MSAMLTERRVVVIIAQSRSNKGFPQKRRVAFTLLNTCLIPGLLFECLCYSFARNRQFPSFHNHAYLANWRDRTTVMCVWSFRITLFIFKCSTVKLAVRFHMKWWDCWEEINKAMREYWPDAFLFYLPCHFIINAPCGRLRNGLFIAFCL